MSSPLPFTSYFHFHFYFVNTAWVSDPTQGGLIFYLFVGLTRFLKPSFWGQIIGTTPHSSIRRCPPPLAVSRILVPFTYRASQFSLIHVVLALDPTILPWISTFSLVHLRRRYLSTISTPMAIPLMIPVFVLSMFRSVHPPPVFFISH